MASSPLSRPRLPDISINGRPARIPGTLGAELITPPTVMHLCVSAGVWTYPGGKRSLRVCTGRNNRSGQLPTVCGRLPPSGASHRRPGGRAPPSFVIITGEGRALWSGVIRFTGEACTRTKVLEGAITVERLKPGRASTNFGDGRGPTETGPLLEGCIITSEGRQSSARIWAHMMLEVTIQSVRTELETGIALPKCQKCGCMDSTLKNLAAVLPTIGTNEATILREGVSAWLEKMRPIQYSCLGCEYCYPAVAQNAFGRAFPTYGSEVADLSCEFRVNDESWPPVEGEYVVVDEAASVAVSTLASIELPDGIAQRTPNGLAIVGKTETENIGIDKVIKNVVTSSTIRHLIVAGREPKGHLTGETLLLLAKNGVDDEGRVIGSRGKRPILQNVSAVEIQAFREQVQMVDMIENDNPDEIASQIEELSRQTTGSCGCNACCEKVPISISTMPRVTASEPCDSVTMDKAGYFVIIPLADKGIISVEHYAYDNSLLRTIEGKTARAIYSTMIDHGWVTELSHAAYLGKELAKAELSLQLSFKFVQDGA